MNEEFFCDECGEEFTVWVDEETDVVVCPFCGTEIELD